MKEEAAYFIKEINDLKDVKERMQKAISEKITDINLILSRDYTRVKTDADTLYKQIEVQNNNLNQRAFNLNVEVMTLREEIKVLEHRLLVLEKQIGKDYEKS